MADRPRYEAEPSPRFLAALRVAVPGFEPTPLGWIEFEIELKRRLRLRDQAAYAANHQACWEWSEDEVLEVFTPSAAAPPQAAERPGFPAVPLDPWCVVSADLSLETREEIVRLVRLVQTDFDPENDPRGWDSVAVLVRGVGYGEEEVRRMGYPQLAAIFRTSAAQMRLQKTGSLVCGIATSTFSIVPLNESAAVPSPDPAPPQILRLNTRGRSTRAIDVDGPLAKLELRMRKKFEVEYGQSETAVTEAMARELYSLSSDNLVPLLKTVGCKVSARGIRRNSAKYAAWERYRKPTAPPSVAADLGPAGRAGVVEGEAPGPSLTLAAKEDLSAGGLSMRVGGRGATRTSKTAAERAAERDADQFARDAGVELPPAE